jgi:hypothetical protein
MSSSSSRIRWVASPQYVRFLSTVYLHSIYAFFHSKDTACTAAYKLNKIPTNSGTYTATLAAEQKSNSIGQVNIECVLARTTAAKASPWL